MADIPRDRIFIGVHGCVVALEATTGREVWRTKLRGQGFVTAGLLGGRLLAATSGRLFSLDPVTGAVLWENRLKGLGFGLISVAGVGANGALEAAAATMENQRRAAAAGAV
jgi:outer membrane protein assembly factor BamB